MLLDTTFLCGAHISKGENFGHRQAVHNSLSPSQERNHLEFLSPSVSQWEMGKSQKFRNLQLREGEKAQRINIGSLTVTLHVQVFCGISSSFWHLGWVLSLLIFCFQTGLGFFLPSYNIAITLSFQYSHVYVYTA